MNILIHWAAVGAKNFYRALILLYFAQPFSARNWHKKLNINQRVLPRHYEERCLFTFLSELFPTWSIKRGCVMKLQNKCDPKWQSCKSLDLADSHLTVPISVFSVARKIVVTRTKNNTGALYSTLTAHLSFNCFSSLVWFSLLIVHTLDPCLDIYCASIDRLSAHTPGPATITSEEGCFVSWM